MHHTYQLRNRVRFRLLCNFSQHTHQRGRAAHRVAHVSRGHCMQIHHYRPSTAAGARALAGKHRSVLSRQQTDMHGANETST